MWKGRFTSLLYYPTCPISASTAQSPRTVGSLITCIHITLCRPGSDHSKQMRTIPGKSLTLSWHTQAVRNDPCQQPKSLQFWHQWIWKLAHHFPAKNTSETSVTGEDERVWLTAKPGLERPLPHLFKMTWSQDPVASLFGPQGSILPGIYWVPSILWGQPHSILA